MGLETIIIALALVAIAIAAYAFIAFRRMKLALAKKQKASPARIALTAAYLAIMLFIAAKIFAEPRFFAGLGKDNAGLIEGIAGIGKENILLLLALPAVFLLGILALKLKRKKLPQKEWQAK
ncbi:MAG: hypothetical protein HY394_05490 [Candidatus Diapherotrites archaeon]|nr:hypothetical protein [Candidatus Diapherotrites archaeon]